MYEEDMKKLLVQRWGMRPVITSMDTVYPITEGRFWPVARMETGDGAVETDDGSIKSGLASVDRWSPKSPDSESWVKFETEDNVGT